MHTVTMAEAKEVVYSRDAELPLDPEVVESTKMSGEDAKDMYRLGKQQEFKRNFKFVSDRK